MAIGIAETIGAATTIITIGPADAQPGLLQCLGAALERLRARGAPRDDTDAGLPRAERELAAAAASRTNGCLFCASVHSRFAARLSDRAEDVQRLLDEGVDADQDGRWAAVIHAAAALTATPSRFGPEHVAALRTAGFDDEAIVDVIQSAAFFGWANRLMLSLGEPTPPTE